MLMGWCIKIIDMAEFKVGRKVICVDASMTHSDIPNPLRKNKIYEVFGISNSACCGVLLLDIGLINQHASLNFCWHCKALLRAQRTWWLRASRFIPLDDFKEVTFTKINEEVPVSAQ